MFTVLFIQILNLLSYVIMICFDNVTQHNKANSKFMKKFYIDNVSISHYQIKLHYIFHILVLFPIKP